MESTKQIRLNSSIQNRNYFMETAYATRKQVFENRHMKMEIIDGILHMHYKKDLVITLIVARNCVEEKLRFLDGNEYPTIVYDEGILSIDREARQLFASDAGTKGFTAFAFIKKNILSKILIDFFLRVSSPKIKSRAFTNPEEAMAWIRNLENRKPAAASDCFVTRLFCN